MFRGSDSLHHSTPPPPPLCLNHARRASERLQRSLEVAGPFFETPAVGDRRLHAVAAGAQARRRRRFRAGRRLQQLAEADAPGGGQPLGAIRGQRAQRRPRHRIELHPHRLAGPGELAVRVDQAVQLVPQRFGGSALPVALEQHVGGEPIPVLEALYVGRPARAQQVVRKLSGPLSVRGRGAAVAAAPPAGLPVRSSVTSSSIVGDTPNDELPTTAGSRFSTSPTRSAAASRARKLRMGGVFDAGPLVQEQVEADGNHDEHDADRGQTEPRRRRAGRSPGNGWSTASGRARITSERRGREVRSAKGPSPAVGRKNPLPPNVAHQALELLTRRVSRHAWCRKAHQHEVTAWGAFAANARTTLARTSGICGSSSRPTEPSRRSSYARVGGC